MSTSCSLCIVMPSFVNIDIVPSSNVLPTLISELGKSSNESALAARPDSCLNGRQLTCRAVLVRRLLDQLVLVMVVWLVDQHSCDYVNWDNGHLRLNSTLSGLQFLCLGKFVLVVSSQSWLFWFLWTMFLLILRRVRCFLWCLRCILSLLFPLELMVWEVMIFVYAHTLFVCFVSLCKLWHFVFSTCNASF